MPVAALWGRHLSTLAALFLRLLVAWHNGRPNVRPLHPLEFPEVIPVHNKIDLRPRQEEYDEDNYRDGSSDNQLTNYWFSEINQLQ